VELNGQQTIKASRDAVYEALNNVDVLKQCVPGCQSLEKTSDTEMSAVVALKIGPVKAKFNGAVTLTNLNAPESYTIVGEGSGGAAGFAKGSADVTLSEQGDETLLDYQVKADVGGKLAQLGNRLIDSTAKKLSNEFFVKFGEIVEAGPEAWTEDEAEEAKDTAKDAKPAPAATEGGVPRWVWIAAAVAALIAVYTLS